MVIIIVTVMMVIMMMVTMVLSPTPSITTTTHTPSTPSPIFPPSPRSHASSTPNRSRQLNEPSGSAPTCRAISRHFLCAREISPSSSSCVSSSNSCPIMSPISRPFFPPFPPTNNNCPISPEISPFSDSVANTPICPSFYNSAIPAGVLS